MKNMWFWERYIFSMSLFDFSFCFLANNLRSIVRKATLANPAARFPILSFIVQQSSFIFINIAGNSAQVISERTNSPNFLFTNFHTVQSSLFMAALA